MNSIPEKPVVSRNDLPNVDDVEPLSASDEECLRDVGEILERWGKQDRFGVSLAHRHFDLEEGEVMVEYCDVEGRVLTTQPRQLNDLQKAAVLVTGWSFDDGLELVAIARCVINPKTNEHMTVPEKRGSEQ